jgi:ubiquinone/menaquinone biosynthesis C-methylase UbiE
MDRWDGRRGKIAGRIMSRMNAAMERRAVELLAPRPTDTVAEIGYGPGVGLELLAAKLTSGRVIGVEPSGAMAELASQRLRASISSGRVRLLSGRAEALPLDTDSVDGVLAVNTAMLWAPVEAGLDEVRRVVRPGGRFVSISHRWAVEKHAPLERWVRDVEARLRTQGFELGSTVVTSDEVTLVADRPA